ncbi:MAG: alpha/beta hydrolase [Alphaproteobacteria bacterium]
MLKIIKSNCAKPNRLMIFLHGYGADAQDLAGLFPYFEKELSGTLFVSIESPFACDVFPAGRQWYPLGDGDRLGFHTQNAEVIQRFIQRTKSIRESVLKQIEETVSFLSEKYKIQSKNIIIAGFSQGAGLGLALSQQFSVGGIISYSGLLFPPYSGKTPLIMFHGTADSVLPFSYAQSIKDKIEKEHPLTFIEIPNADHTIPLSAIEKSIEWIKNTCAKN